MGSTSRVDERATSASASAARPALDAARCVVRVSDALERVMGVTRDDDAREALAAATADVKALARCIAPMAMSERDSTAKARETATWEANGDARGRALARRVEALERALAESRKKREDLEREVGAERSEWMREAKRELDAALRRVEASRNGERERALERETRRLRAANEEMRAEALELEQELVRCEKARRRLEKENELLVDATRAARKEFERRDREAASANAARRAATNAATVAMVTSPGRTKTTNGQGRLAPSPSQLPAYLGSPFGGVRTRD